VPPSDASRHHAHRQEAEPMSWIEILVIAVFIYLAVGTAIAWLLMR
jgi:hypothetical protein